MKQQMARMAKRANLRCMASDLLFLIRPASRSGSIVNMNCLRRARVELQVEHDREGVGLSDSQRHPLLQRLNSDDFPLPGGKSRNLKERSGAPDHVRHGRQANDPAVGSSKPEGL